MCSLMILQHKVKERLTNFESLGLQFGGSPTPSIGLSLRGFTPETESNPVENVSCANCLNCQSGWVPASAMNGCINPRYRDVIYSPFPTPVSRGTGRKVLGIVVFL